MATVCSHLDTIDVIDVPAKADVPGCEECLKTGDRWVHLRVCRECGKVGCCDDSPNQHASKHFAADGHPIITSIEPGEDWSWCFVDEAAFRIAGPA